jgi:hypothetical protein
MNTIPEKWTVLFHLSRSLLDMPLNFGLGSQKMALKTGVPKSTPTSVVSSAETMPDWVWVNFPAAAIESLTVSVAASYLPWSGGFVP